VVGPVPVGGKTTTHVHVAWIAAHDVGPSVAVHVVVTVCPVQVRRAGHVVRVVVRVVVLVTVSGQLQG